LEEEMAKVNKNKNIHNKEKKEVKSTREKGQEAKLSKNAIEGKDPDVLFAMSHAPKLDGHSQSSLGLWLGAFFTAVIIMITRMHAYERPMDQFFWSGGNNQLTDFFSYYKSMAILTCAILALVILLYRVVTQSLLIKRSYAYIPMIVYSVFVLLSYITSDYKEVALWGWNDRFEGTIILLAYMVMLFFIINTVHTEKDVKWIVYATAVTSFILSLLGLSQALDKDFFRTVIGKKLITPSWFWDQVDNLNFTFQNREIYQTVYNINYVSFYLTLLIPLFGMLFIQEKKTGKKIAWGVLFFLLVFNLIGSKSSGGLLGMAVVVLIAIIVLNKRIIQWWRPVVVLVAITLLVSGLTYERWMPELFGAVNSVVGKQVLTVPGQEPVKKEETDEAPVEPAIRHYIDYIETEGNDIRISIEGNEMTLTTYPDNPEAVKVLDANGESIELVPTEVSPVYAFDDPDFTMCTLQPSQDEKGSNYFILTTDEHPWPFRLTEEGPLYLNGMGALVDLHKVPTVGWEDNQSFGSGRGYIWSRTIPMMNDTLLLGYGADTYCIYFPHEDYVGKYNADSFTNNINIIVDKPHNMYMGIAVGTGGLSLLAFLALAIIYIVQSIRLIWNSRFEIFLSYAGAGVFLGICGFMIAGLVNDSTVSVMPMYYGLLGTGLTINIILRRPLDKIE
jgi:hypothetical protein